MGLGQIMVGEPDHAVVDDRVDACEIYLMVLVHYLGPSLRSIANAA